MISVQSGAHTPAHNFFHSAFSDCHRQQIWQKGWRKDEEFISCVQKCVIYHLIKEPDITSDATHTERTKTEGDRRGGDGLMYKVHKHTHSIWL